MENFYRLAAEYARSRCCSGVPLHRMSSGVREEMKADGVCGF